MIETAFSILSKAALSLPESSGRAFACAFGMLASKLPFPNKARMFATIDRVYFRHGIQPPAKIAAIVERMFIHFALNSLELLRAPLYSKQKLDQSFDFRGWEHFDRAVQQNKGLVLVLPHIGNWELLGAALAFRGYKIHSFVVGDQKKSSIGRKLNGLREHSRITLHDRDHGSIGALRALKSGEILAMIADQDGGQTGIYGDFLKHWVSSPAGPANWSLKTGAAIIPLYCLRIGNSSRFTATFLPPFPDENTGSHEERMLQRTRKILIWMEQLILSNPHQYLWFYDRFRPRHEGSATRLKQSGAHFHHGEMISGLRDNYHIKQSRQS